MLILLICSDELPSLWIWGCCRVSCCHASDTVKTVFSSQSVWIERLGCNLHICISCGFSLSSVSKKNLSGYILKMPKNGCGLANCPRTWCPCSILVNWLIVIFANVFVIFAKINITSTVEMISTDISPNKFQLWDSSDSSRETLRILSYMKSKTRLSFSLKDTKTSILTMKICGTLLAKSPPYQGLASS